MSIYRGFSTTGSDFATPTVTDYLAAKIDLQNNLNVRRGERIMRPDFGCIVWDMLYDPFTDEMYDALIENITAIGNNDPRLSLLNITPTTHEHGIKISMTLKYIPTNQVEKMLFTFNKEASSVSLGSSNTGTANGY
jgi:phage baseplate assembly protein W